MIRQAVAAWKKIRRGFRPEPPSEILVNVVVQLDSVEVANAVHRELIRRRQRGERP